MKDPAPHMPPTHRQEEAAGLYRELGTYLAVAERMGVSESRVSQLLYAYRRRTGETRARTWGTGTWAQRSARLEAAIDALLTAADQVTRPAQGDHPEAAISRRLDLIDAKLDALLARPAVVPFAADHRRVADGGRHVAEQRRAARRGAA